MRLPQPLLESPLFLFDRIVDLERALGPNAAATELAEIQRLLDAALPPVTSQETLATMFGLNAGIVWSLIHRSRKHYRTFALKKGRGWRQIKAPRIALKTIQKWISVHLARSYQAPEHVHGFVPGKSHISAAERHLHAKWVFSVDIENFFPTTPENLVVQELVHLGYSPRSASLISSLCCLDGVLAQGAPSSPVLSNLCFSQADHLLSHVAQGLGVRFTRYADDLTFSGTGTPPKALATEVFGVFENLPWNLSREKTILVEHPNRLKVHGLLVHGSNVRLTKGYRNRLRLLQHLESKGCLSGKALERAIGHRQYGALVSAKSAMSKKTESSTDN